MREIQGVIEEYNIIIQGEGLDQGGIFLGNLRTRFSRNVLAQANFLEGFMQEADMSMHGEWSDV